jgi:hypothetical protein
MPDSQEQTAESTLATDATHGTNLSRITRMRPPGHPGPHQLSSWRMATIRAAVIPMRWIAFTYADGSILHGHREMTSCETTGRPWTIH